MTVTYLLVDWGYLFFYRYHATKLWYKRAHEYVDDLVMAGDPIFKATFQKRVKGCICEKMKKHKVKWENVIICRDTRRSEIWRHAHHGDYKGNRDTGSLTGLGLTSGYLKEVIFDILREHHVKCIGLKSAEADDIIYICKRRLSEVNPEARFVIVASDCDYYQIIDERTSLVRLDKKDPMTKSTRNTHNLDIVKSQEIDLLVKIIQGDSSDNIVGCFPKCGAKTSLTLALNPEKLQLHFKRYEGSLERFNNNSLLIDMRNIPMELQIKVISKVDICFGFY
jgi:5'-3' exonuclease